MAKKKKRDTDITVFEKKEEVKQEPEVTIAFSGKQAIEDLPILVVAPQSVEETTKDPATKLTTKTTREKSNLKPLNSDGKPKKFISSYKVAPKTSNIIQNSMSFSQSVKLGWIKMRKVKGRS